MRKVGKNARNEKHSDDFIKKWKQVMPIVLLPIVSYGILGPFEIYCGNQKDFSYHFTDFFGMFLMIAAVIWLGLSILVAILPDKIYKVITTLITGFGLASYLQNMFMNIKLSEIDGSPMRWEELEDFTILNLMIWFVVIVLVCACSFIFKKYWKAISLCMSGFLCAIQLAAVISLIVTQIASADDRTGELQMSGEKQYKVASDENIIIFVLDTFGNTQLERLLEQYPDALEGLHDFTFYNNADCHYYCTFPSMTHMFTGNEFDFEAGSEEWLNTSWNTDRAVAFWNKVKETGYGCYLYSSDLGYVYGDIENLYGKFDNIEPLETVVDHSRLLYLLGKMSVYKFVPYIVKPYFEVLNDEFNSIVSFTDGIDVITDNGDFYSSLIKDRLETDQKMKKAMIIQHLNGTHLPYTIDENAMTVEESDVVRTAKGLMVIVNEYIQQMKKLGIYEKSTIMIMADHGSWAGGDPQPIYFIKQSGEIHEDMLVNKAPISADDFQATILNLLDLDDSDFGTSIFAWKEGDKRTRTVYMRTVDDNYPDVQGSGFNVYYMYSYVKDKAELNAKINAGPEAILPATTWKQ